MGRESIHSCGSEIARVSPVYKCILFSLESQGLKGLVGKMRQVSDGLEA